MDRRNEATDDGDTIATLRATLADLSATINSLQAKVSKVTTESEITDPGADEAWKELVLGGGGGVSTLRMQLLSERTALGTAIMQNAAKVVHRMDNNAVSFDKTLDSVMANHRDVGGDRLLNVDEQGYQVANILKSLSGWDATTLTAVAKVLADLATAKVNE